MITYEISAYNPNRHTWRVNLTIPFNNQKDIQIYLPNWTLGSYLIRDFCRQITFCEPLDQNQDQLLRQINKNTWELSQQSENTWQICYEVYAYDVSVRGTYLDTERGFINGSALFLAVKGLENEPCEVQLRLPENWQIASALCDDEHQTTLHADNYTHLVDSPITMAKHMQILKFTAGDKPHRIAITGQYQYLDSNRLIEDATKICQAPIHLFCNKTPFEHYTFLLHVENNVYGGLEHVSSSALMISPEYLPSLRDEDNRQQYIVFMGLISHEYFHAWNVRSIKPAVFVDNPMLVEAYTEQLWAFEGITSYYDDLLLLRANVINQTEYLYLVAKNISRVLNQPGRLRQTLAESSFNAWTKYYRQDENSPNTIVSYYQKGAIMAMCLDLVIREKSNFKHTLDDVMRALYDQCTEGYQGIAEGQWQHIAEEVCGISLEEFFQQALYSTQDLPLSELFAKFGVTFDMYESSSVFVGISKPEPTYTLDFGWQYKEQSNGYVITHIQADSIAEQMALSVQDCIIAINHYDYSQFEKVLEQLQPNDELTIHFFRKGYLKTATIQIPNNFKKSAYLIIQDEKKLSTWLSETVEKPNRLLSWLFR